MAGGEWTPAKIDGWVTLAQPRARIVYHAGVALTGAPAGVADRLRLFADHGLVILNLARDDSDPAASLAWFATRTEKPAPKGLAALKPIVAAPASAGVTVPHGPRVERQRPIGPGGRVW